ncbi:MAG: Do family serine endopeptidase [Acidobacteria bacterium]|nr:Do family serine endopeptidase [Acidobacteriota bacterium]MBI3663173.1 Do family serine endopeptidase [Acidobacteriota bacterium]
METRNWFEWAKQRKLGALILVTLTLAVGILIGTVVSGRVSATRNQGGDPGAALLAVPSPVQLSSAFAAIADKVEPAVVNISTTQVVERRRAPQRRRTPPQQQDPFQDFFDRFFDGQEAGPQQPERSLGSGVVVDKKGYILTNNHVVERASKIQVKLNGGRTVYTAKVVGTDEETDLAIIKIEADHDLPTAKLGNSDAVKVGDWVLAFGSPFGLDATVTAGIVSAKDRANIGLQFQRFIQTDAAINPGNSGGPLVNMAGEIIGINTAIYTMSRGFDGVGFAMPSNTAVSVYNQLVQFGRVTRGSIGIIFTEERSTNPVTLKELGAPHGIIIESVEPGAPAAKAGLQPGDVITEVNGQAVRTGTDLVNPIAQTPIGQKVKLTYVRDRQKREVTVAVEDRTKIFPRGAARDDQPEEDGPVEFGLRVEELTPELSRKLGMEDRRGVIVAQVEPTSFAEDLGFQPRDIVVEVNREAVTSLAEYRRAVARVKPGQSIMFKVLRRAGEDRYLTMFLSGVVPNPQ